jgi:hypothetical protein
MLTSMLLLQTTVTPHLPTIAEEIALHPYLFLGLLGMLGTGVVALAKYFLSSFENRVNEKFSDILAREAKQEGRLDKIEEDLKGYDKHVAVGIKETSEIHDAIKRVESTLTEHTRKEETVTWTKIDDLVVAVNDLKLSNEVQHERLSSGQSVLSTRVGALESSMPNGELAQLRLAIKSLTKKPASKKRK